MNLRGCFAKDNQSNSKVTIRQAFRKKLLLLIIGAFALTFSISYYMQTWQAEERARSFLADQLMTMCERVSNTERSRIYLKNRLNDDLVSKARVFARMLVLRPDLIMNKQMLAESCRDYDLAGVRITDASGMIVGCYPEDYVGIFNFSKHPETLKYLPLIKDKELVIAEEPRISVDVEPNFSKFVGVARQDQPGIIQVKFSGNAYTKYMAPVSFDNLVRGDSCGESGAFYIFNKKGIIEGATDSSLKGLSLEEVGLDQERYQEINGFFSATPKDGVPSLCAYDKQGDCLVIATYPESEIYAKRNSLLVWNGVLYFLLFVAVYILVSLLLETSVVRNIFSVNKSLASITQGNLEEKINVRDYQEFALLSSSINSTVDALKKAIAEAAARLDRELEIARIIQSSSLPNQFPPWPDLRDFDIYAEMQMATQVGGDFYDFFLVGDKLGIVMADVSGHGIPAALFMMTARTHIKNHMLEDGDLGEEFARVNNLLCSNNEALMFVTVFAAVLDYKTGKMTCVNAGHNKPLIKHQGQYDWVQQRSGLVMGSLENMKYKPFEVQLEHGDIFCIYTDGITEGINKAGEQFGNDRLQETLNQAGTEDVTAIVKHLKAAVDEFTAGTEPDDDRTILVLKWN
jgi:serine phosphatase RsbU (regulator of sigma subunit)